MVIVLIEPWERALKHEGLTSRTLNQVNKVVIARLTVPFIRPILEVESAGSAKKQPFRYLTSVTAPRGVECLIIAKP